MTPQRRSLIHAVMDGELTVLPLCHQLIHYRSCDKFLKWLVLNRITGKTLLSWLKIEHRGSVMGMVQFIIKNSNKNKEVQPIILNKDWVK